MEDIVDGLMPIALSEQKSVCICSNCIEDIRAKALNGLKPLYIVTEKGVMYAKLNELKTQFRADVIGEIVKAIQIVSNNPRHNL
jgi:competence protein ComFB